MRSFRIFFCALLLAGLAGAFSPAAAQRAVWATMLPNCYVDLNFCNSATDSAGNTYLAGSFGGRVSVGGFTIQTATTSPLDIDLFVLKVNPAGRVEWLRRAGGSALRDSTQFYDRNDLALSLACNRRGDLYWLAKTSNDFTFGSHHLDSAATFLTKLDAATGEPLWVTPIAGPSRGQYIGFADLAVDPAGACYLAAQTPSYRPFTLGSLTVPASPAGKSLSHLVARCDSTGQFTWVSPVYGRDHSNIPGYAPSLVLASITVDAGGRVVVGGSSFGWYYFGGARAADSVAAVPGDTVIVNRPTFVRYTAAGAVAWVQRADILGSTYSVATDGASNTFATVYLFGAGSFLGVPINSPAGYRAALVKLDPAGQPQWLKRAGNGLGNLTVDDLGRPYVVCSFIDSVSFGAFHLTGMSGSYFNPCVAAFDANGHVRWARTSNPLTSTPMAGTSGVGVDAAGHVYTVSLMWRSSTTQDFDGHIVKGRGGVIVRYDEAALITGSTYLDQNANNRRDPGESAFPRPVIVSETARPYAASSSPTTGTFTVFADTGQYHVSIPQVPRYHTLTQGAAGYTGHLRTYGQTDTARVFGLAPIPNRTDVRVTLTPYGNARRGFANRYRARIENLGTVTADGVLTVQFDGLMLYSGAPTPPTSNTATSATWNFASLAPFEVRDFDVAATTPITAPLDTLLHSQATVTVANDLDLTNNVDAVTQRVTGSYDPNDLTVNYATLTPAQVAAGTLLDYVVRFQNMGTDTAFTVVITDTLPAQLLQLGTLELVGASHNCWYDMLTSNQLVIHFDNINLPASSTSILNSMGFVRFQVKPDATLTPGALIPNTAHIFFDYNAPLATNDVTTLVQTPNGLVAEPGAGGDAGMQLYPNPAVTNTITLTTDMAVAGSAVVRVLDPLGQLVRAQSGPVAAGAQRLTLDVRGLAAGLYVVRLTGPNGASTSQKLVVGERR